MAIGSKVAAFVLRVESATTPAGIVHRAIVALAEEDGREVAIDVEAADLARVSDAAFDHAPIDVVEVGGSWRVALDRRP